MLVRVSVPAYTTVGASRGSKHGMNWKRERGHKRKAEKKRGRTMDTSFVVSAAFCAPVVTESQNDMAVFVAIAVWTEMVAFLVVSKTREQGHARCFLTTRRAYLSTRPFFALEKKKKCAFERNTKILRLESKGGVKKTIICECGSMRTIVVVLLLNATVFARLRPTFLSARGHFHLPNRSQIRVSIPSSSAVVDGVHRVLG